MTISEFQSLASVFATIRVSQAFDRLGFVKSLEKMGIFSVFLQSLAGNCGIACDLLRF